MVGQARSTLSTYHKGPLALINLRELILLSIGLVNRSLTIDEAYTMTKNLEVRIEPILEYKVPNFHNFRDVISKLVKDGIIQQSYSLAEKKYVITLTQSGEGEFDYLLHSIANPKLIQIFDEYKSLIDLYY